MTNFDPTTLRRPAEMDRVERARRAVKVARTRTHELTAYLRSYTHDNDAKIVWSAGTPCTDGTTIYMRPPIEWGDELTHDRTVCTSRDARGVLRCDACRTDEEVGITLRHEIGHMVAGSFDTLNEYDKIEALKAALIEAGVNDESKRATKIKNELRYSNNFIRAAEVVSPYLPVIVNALEDVRVNVAMYKARPGLFKQFKAQSVRIFEEGNTGLDGTVQEWRDQPPNMQVAVGLYAKFAGYDYEDYFSDDVVECLNDPKLERIMRNVHDARSVRTTYKLAFPALEVLREHGFCKTSDDFEDDPPPQMSGPNEEQQDAGTGEQEETEEVDLEAGPSTPSMPEADDEPGDQKDTGDNDESGDDQSGAADQDAADTDQEADQDAADGGAGADDQDDETGDGSDDSESGDGDGDGDDDAPSDELEGNAPTRATDDEPGDDDDINDSDGDDIGDGHEDFGDGEHVPDADEAEAEAEDIRDALDKMGGHEEFGGRGLADTPMDQAYNEQELDRAVEQGEYFDQPSVNIYGIDLYDDISTQESAWKWGEIDEADLRLVADESILAPALQQMRVTFSDNKKARMERNRRSGRINARVLGRRVPLDDDRIFQKKREPGARDYFVTIGLDVSGSTMDRVRLEEKDEYGNTKYICRLDLIKAAAYAQAELLHRAGIPFAVYAHTTGMNYEAGMNTVAILAIKKPEQRWDEASRTRLRSLSPHGGNLDGHSLEFYRKVTEQQRATDRFLLYYTDGQFPAGNDEEELEIILRELKEAPRRNIKIVGVGVNTSSPTKYGIDTVRIDTLADVPLLVKELKKRLT